MSRGGNVGFQQCRISTELLSLLARLLQHSLPLALDGKMAIWPSVDCLKCHPRMVFTSVSIGFAKQGMLMKNRVAKAVKSLFPSLEGHLLVAAPGWGDDLFGRTVCLVVHHGSKGAVGILLNRGLDSSAANLWQHLSGGEVEESPGVLHLGGPQSGPVVALHTCSELAEFETGEGVYLAAEVQNLQSLVQSSLDPSTTCDCKIILGQVDWEQGQLEEELQTGHWLPLPVSQEVVFEDPELMWARAMMDIGNRFVAGLTRSVPTPNPLLN